MKKRVLAGSMVPPGHLIFQGFADQDEWQRFKYGPWYGIQ